MAHAKIMIVEDEVDLLQALTMRFKSSGYEVVQAMDGVTATQLAVREQPDIIVLDIGLPGGDGHTVAERLRKNVKSMSIPVIYLTARNSEVDKHKAAELGAAAYLTKPFKAQELMDIVTKLVIGVPVGSP